MQFLKLDTKYNYPNLALSSQASHFLYFLLFMVTNPIISWLLYYTEWTKLRALLIFSSNA